MRVYIHIRKKKKKTINFLFLYF